jgi:hypothetical protein
MRILVLLVLALFVLVLSQAMRAAVPAAPTLPPARAEPGPSVRALLAQLGAPSLEEMRAMAESRLAPLLEMLRRLLRLMSTADAAAAARYLDAAHGPAPRSSD